MCVPVVDPEENILAVIKVVNKNFVKSPGGGEMEEARWSEEDSLILQSIAESAGVALHKGKLLRDVMNEQKKNKSLIAVMKTINKFQDNVDEQIKELVAITYQMIDVERVTLFLVDEVRKELICTVSKDKDFEGTRLPIGNGIAGQVAREGETLIVQDVEKDTKFSKWSDQHTGFKTKNILCMPIRDHRKKIIAIIQLLNKNANFNDYDVDVLEAFSQEIASAIKKALLEKAFHRGKSEEDESLLGLFAQYSTAKSTSQKKPVTKRGSMAFGNRQSLNHVDVRRRNSSGAYGNRTRSSVDYAIEEGGSPLNKSSDSETNAKDNDNNNKEPTPQPSPNPSSRQLGITTITRKVSDVALEDLLTFPPSDKGTLVEKMNCWDFDVLKYDTRRLVLVAREMIMHYDLPNEFEMGESHLGRFLFAVSKKYRANPFHNFYHAAAVLHISYMMMSKVGCEEFLEKRDIMCCLIGAIVHDIDHTGFNNDFEKNSMSTLALTYNDKR